VRTFVTKQLAQQLAPQLQALVAANDAAPGEAYSPDAASSSRRALKNRALQLLACLAQPAVTAECLRRCREAGNMTDQVAALGALVDLPVPERQVRGCRGTGGRRGLLRRRGLSLPAPGVG
jgi:aminopeptidase N